MKLANISAAAVIALLSAGAAAAKEQSSSSSPAPARQGSPAPQAQTSPGATAASSETSAASTPSAMSSGVNASGVTPRIITNGPIPDTRENRAAFGKPLSQAGRNTKPAGN